MSQDFLVSPEKPLPKTDAEFVDEFKKLLEIRRAYLASDPTTSSARLSVLEWSAVELWHRLTDAAMDWALSGYRDFFPEFGVGGPIGFPSKYQTDLEFALSHRDTRILQERLARASKGRKRSYAVVVLPTHVATTSAEELMKLSYGEGSPMFKPAARRNYKDGITIPLAQAKILEAAEYFVGGGLSALAARKKIATASNGLITAAQIVKWANREDLLPLWNPTTAKLSGAYHSGMSVANAFEKFAPTGTHIVTFTWKWERCGRAETMIDGGELGKRIKALADAMRSQKGGAHAAIRKKRSRKPDN
jgi:hypothetical protein